MIQVSHETIEAWKEDGTHKKLKLYFPSLNLTIDNTQIEKESFSLSEKLTSKSDLEFVGCISSCMQVTIHDDTHYLKNQEVVVTIQADDTEVIPLFRGYIDSISTELESTKKILTAYDALYSKASDLDVASWYNSLGFPITLKALRDSIFSKVGIIQNDISLPNDDVIIVRQYDPQELNALDVIKSICQINGMFGIIDRYGKFAYKIPTPYTIGLFPGASTYPGIDTIPGATSGKEATYLGFYEKLYYEEFMVNKLARVMIRNSNSEPGVISGYGTNTYIVEGNIFAYGLSEGEWRTIGTNILNMINNVPYTPFNSTLSGTPFMEVGDYISMLVYDGRTNTTSIKNFTVFNRTLKGVQHIKDTINADGVENQKTFISNLNTRLQTLTQQRSENDKYYDKDEIDNKFSDVDNKISEIPQGFKIVSVESVPTYSIDDKTLYLIQGECFTVYDEKNKIQQ